MINQLHRQIEDWQKRGLKEEMKLKNKKGLKLNRKNERHNINHS